MKTTVGLKPDALSSAAQAKASPPLLPGPANNTMRASGKGAGDQEVGSRFGSPGASDRYLRVPPQCAGYRHLEAVNRWAKQ